VLVSAVLVAGGAFGLGFCALAVGGALLLRPPRQRTRGRAGLARRAGRGLAGLAWTGVAVVAAALRWGARRLGESGRALGRGAAIAAPHVRRGARTGAQWTSERGRRVAGLGGTWVGRAGAASYRAARVGGRRGGSALGSTARGAASLAVAAGTRARTTAVSEAAHLGTVTLVPVAPGPERGRAPDPAREATAIVRDGSDASVLASAGEGIRTEASAAEPLVDAEPATGEPAAQAMLAASGRAPEDTVVASTAASQAPRARQSKRVRKKSERKRAGETKQGASRDDADPSVAPAGAASESMDAPETPVGEESGWAAARSQSGAVAQSKADAVAPAGESPGEADAPPVPAKDANEPTDVPVAPAKDANEPTDVPVAPAKDANEPTDRRAKAANELRDVPDAPARETNGSADGSAETVADEQDEAGPGSPSPSEEATEPKDAAGEPAQANEPTDAPAALAEANDRADATTAASETGPQTRGPTETVGAANEEAEAAAEPKSRTRKPAADLGGAASEPTEARAPGDDADAPTGAPHRRKQTKRTPRTTTPQGERTPQQSR
jgi:hypothetical protein